MKFEEAMKLLKEGKKIYLSRPGYSVGSVGQKIYYINKHKKLHELTYCDVKQKWFDYCRLYLIFSVDELFSDEWEEYKWKEED